MKTKTIFLWVLLAMLVGGVNGAWADNTYELILNQSYQEIVNGTAGTAMTDVSAFNSSSVFYDATQGDGGGFNTRFEGTYNSTSYTRGLKMNAGASISFTTTNYTKSVVSIVQCTTDKNESSTKTIRFDGTELAISSATTPQSSTNCREYTISDVNGGNHTITYGSGESGLFYVKVVMSDPTYTFGIEDLCYEHGYYNSDLNREVGGITIEPSGGVQSYTNGSQYQLLVDNNASLTFTPNTDNSTVKIKKVELTLSDNSIITVNNDATGSVVCTNISGSRKTIVSIKITTDDALIWSKSTPTLTFSPQKVKYNTSSAGVEQNVGATPDFTLTTSPTAFRLNYIITNSGSGTTINHHLSTKRVGIFPGSTKGREVLTASFSGNDFFNEASATLGVSITDGSYEGEYTTTTSTDLYVANGNSIPSAFPGGTVEDGKYLIDGKERNLIGKYTFTEAGTISGGTVISDVPGITMTVGAEGDNNWTVSNNYTSSNYSAGPYATNATTVDRWSFTQGSFYKFVPYVNGFLTIEGKSLSNHTYLYLNNSNQNDIGYFNNWNNGVLENSSPYTFTFPLIAGNTYYLCAMSAEMQLHSFTFRPAFLRVNSSGEIINEEASKTNTTVGAEPVGMTTDRDKFPHLIAMPPSGSGTQAGLNKVKFAGDRNIVNLYANNNVELLDDSGESPTLIKGTVLQDNSERELFAYYYLQSTLLKVNSTTLYGNSIADNAYVDATATTGSFVFTFNHNIARVSDEATNNVGIVKVRVDDGGEVDWGASPGQVEISGNTLTLNFNSLVEGSTYRIRIVPNMLCNYDDGTKNKDVSNAEIVRTFTLNKNLEAPIKMIYPTGIATVGTSIVLETYIKNDENKYVDVNPQYKVKGWLNYEGGNSTTGEWIDGHYSANRLIFKPASTLRQNTNYFLKIPLKGTDGSVVVSAGTEAQIVLNEATIGGVDHIVCSVTKPKAFYFTTGAQAGSAPERISSVPTEDPLGNTPVTDYSSGRISFTFDQNVELEPYSIVHATPVNGSEATVTGETKLSEGDSGHNLHIDSDGKTIYFTYKADELKYDLYYQVVIPANTVVGAGGLPNPEPITLNFKMDKNPSSLVSSKVFQGYGAGPIYHPYTWNFTNFGEATLNDLATATVGENYKTLRWRKYDSSYGNFVTDQADKTPKFPQGDVLSYNINSQNKEIKEASGLRWSLTKDFGSALNRVQIPESGTSLHIVGNTHYLTIPDVPAGAKLYIKASKTDLLNVNSPNATFIQGAASDDETNTIGAKTSSSKVYILNCTGGDVSFCLDDVYFEKIAVVTEEKTITEVGYATNAREYAVDYTLNQDFLNKELKAYKVTGVSGSNAVATQVQYVPAYGGVMLKATGDSYPMFAWDCNRVTSDMTENRLVGVVDGASAAVLPQKSGDQYNYILSTGGVNVKYNYEGSIEEIEDKTGTFGGYVSGLAFYLVMKEGTILENGTAYAYEKPKSNSAYLQLDSYLARQTGTGTESGARQYFPIDFGDESTSVTGIEDESRLSTADDSWISLQGVRVENPGKGLYIHKGKKIVIK